MRKLHLITVFLLVVVYFAACRKEEDSYTPLAKLSEYGFFIGNLADMQPAERVLPYDLNTPLFSNYSFKSRFVYIPEGKTATYNDQRAFDFPSGSVLIKTFYYPLDFAHPEGEKRIIETRLLIKRDNGTWFAAAYIWNEAQTEATYNIVGAQMPVSWNDIDGVAQHINYIVPNQNECKGCHSFDGQFVPIGPKAQHLNKTYAYAANDTANQLERWASAGLLVGAPSPENAPKLAQFDKPSTGTLDQRARAYLDINCAHCHNPLGPANNSGLNLGVDVTDLYQLGVCKSPVAAGNGAGNNGYDIVPGNPDASIMIYRMESNDIDIAMPEIGRSIIHAEGVALLREWITQLEGDCN